MKTTHSTKSAVVTITTKDRQYEVLFPEEAVTDDFRQVNHPRGLETSRKNKI